MKVKRFVKNRLRNAVFGCLFAVIGALAGFTGIMVNSVSVYADPVGETIQTEEIPNDNPEEKNDDKKENGENCKDSLGSVGWLVCPTTGKISEAVDWLYDKIETILVINPVDTKDGSPIYEIWKYMKGVTNIVFVIFLLVVIYSQLTGYGITNYGIKKALPKLIVAAILVNLSFVICTLAVDLSNVIGNSLRGLFESIEESAMSSMNVSGGGVKMSEMYSALAGGSALAIGAGAIAFESGAIWMLIPTILGAIVAVVIGLVTIAMRQAVVALLIMISPLAIVAYMLPNTEQWFKKWRGLLTKMLVFYPMFSLLFGASSLAGWAIIASASDGFWVMLGVAVQIFPLFFAWSLMKMSGTFLGDINTRLHGLAARPLATSRRWAESRRDATRARNLSSSKVYTPSLRLMQFMSDRKVARDEETNEHAASIKLRGQAYNARRKYGKNGMPKKEAEEDYAMQARNIRYTEIIDRHSNNMNKGLGQLEVVKGANAAKKARLAALDSAMVVAADRLRMEKERGAQIEYDNAKGFYTRIADAKNAHVDLEAIKNGNKKHQLHSGALNNVNLARYETMKKIMEGKDVDTNFILAGAAHSFGAQSQIVRGKFNDLFSYTAPTQDVVNILDEMTKSPNSNLYIDPIIAGMRTLNMRGDTDLVRRQVENMLKDKKIELGTHASQSLSNFCMFDVKGNDPFLRRFGKYINLETAKMYNEADPKDRRTRKDISLDEYVNGAYVDYDADGNVIYDENNQPKIRKPKKSAAVLLKGTSFKDMERTAIDNMNEAIRESSVDVDENGNRIFNYEKFKKNQKEIWNAIMPNIISDQYSFLSGSEQITALGRGITGMDVNEHKFDWKGIFGKDIADSLTPEQKKDYIDFMNQRTKTFLKGQVPAQIARTKTDILESVRNQYAFKDAMENDEGFFEKGSKRDFKMSDAEYGEFEQKRIDKVKKEFVDSYKEDALKGFIKMHHKGYQGEAKDGLIQLLDPDELYKKYFENGGTGAKNHNRREQQIDDDDDDDGMPVDVMGGGAADDSFSQGEIRNAIESTFDTYRGVSGANVEEFWNEIKPLISDVPGAGTVDFIDEVENSLGQYTDVATLYAHVINRMFGGFE